jgi:parallel beta-helix repeat protein
MWSLLLAIVALGLDGPQDDRQKAEAGSRRAEILVGIDEGDLRGNDNRVLQAAIDQVAALGGGTVRIGPGRFEMRNALTLRNGVDVIGTQGKTILAGCDGATSALACDGDCNERQVTLEDPSGFRIGDGISIQDQDSGGFMVTTATLLEQLDSRTFRISAPLYLDYLVSKRAKVQTAFPIVGGWGARDVTLEGLMIEGNASNRARLDGCRGGGIYLFECKNITIKTCVVRDYHGDGISFQVSENVHVTDCTAEGNRSLGLHPGSGSFRPVLRGNRSRNNGGDGLFVCWRVKEGLFESNEVLENGGAGISIGHKDTDNVFQGNTIVANGGPGVLFREELEAMGAHRNRFEGNRIMDNGRRKDAAAIGIEIRGPHHDLVFRRNVIGLSTAAESERAVGVLRSARASGLKLLENEFPNVGSGVKERD